VIVEEVGVIVGVIIAVKDIVSDAVIVGVVIVEEVGVIVGVIISVKVTVKVLFMLFVAVGVNVMIMVAVSEYDKGVGSLFDGDVGLFDLLHPTIVRSANKKTTPHKINNFILFFIIIIPPYCIS
jgi:hypothetical protein